MNLLLFIALPIAAILLAIVFEKVFNSPVLSTITVFSIYLILLFVLLEAGIITETATALIALVVYTILAFIAAVVFRFIRCICKRFLAPCCSLCPNSDNIIGDVNDNNNSNEENCGCHSNNLQPINDRITVSGDIIPNQNNNGRTGIVRGCYKRYQ